LMHRETAVYKALFIFRLPNALKQKALP
jgi:hypothetical protein